MFRRLDVKASSNS